MTENITGLYRRLQPLIVKDVQAALRGGRPVGGSGGGGGGGEGIGEHVLATTVGLGEYHTVTGLTEGYVLKATSATTAAFAGLNHSELANIGPNDHHTKLHTITDAAHHDVTGAQYSVVGLSATDTLGILATTTNGSNDFNTILRSGATGGLELNYLDLDTDITVPTINSPADMSILPTGNLTINPGDDVLFPQAQTVRSDNFTPGIPIQGWWIGQYTVNETPSTSRNAMQIYSLTIDELRARTFVVDEVRVDRGEEFVTKSYGILTRPFTTPLLVGNAVHAYFEDSPAYTGAIFSNGDYLLFRIFDDSGGGLTIANILFTVAGYVDQGDGEQRWSLTLIEGLTDYEIIAGAVGWDWGQSGQGYIHSSVVDTSGAPYVDIRTWVTGGGAGGPLDGTTTTHVRIGRLISALDSDMSPDGWGLYSDNAYLKGVVYAAGGVVVLNDAGMQVNIPFDGEFDDLYAYRFNNHNAVTLGGLYARYEDGIGVDLNQVAVRALGTDEHRPHLVLTARTEEATGEAGQARTTVQAIGGGGTAEIQLESTETTETIYLRADEVWIEGTLMPFTGDDATYDIGTASLRFKDGYFSGTLHVDGGISGETLTGSEWQFNGSMIIDANNASDTTVSVVNQGAGSVTLDVGGDITLSGTVDGVDIAALAASIVPASRTITAGAGLTGTGTLATDITLDVGAGDGITVNADDIAVDSTVVRTTRTLTAGNGLTGTGDLSADRTFAVGAGTLITVGTDNVSLSNGSAQYQVPVTGATPFTPAWTALSTFAGSGLVFSSGAYAVVAGNGLEIVGDTVAIGTPSTLTAITTNARTATSHTHAITTSFDPGPNAIILQSTSSGGLVLQNMAIEGNLDITNSGDLTVGANIFFVDASVGNVGINCAPDIQFDLDVLGNIRAQGWFVGKHALQIDGAIMICHYDGKLPASENTTGHTEGHMGQVATVATTPLFRAGAFRASKAIEIAESTTNLITNPEFAAGSATGWVDYISGAASGSRATVVVPHLSTHSYRFIKTGGEATANWGAYHTFPVSSGLTYTISAWVNVTAISGGTGTVTLVAGNTVFSQESTTITGLTGGWVRMKVTAAATATGSGWLQIFIDNADTATVYVANVQAENKNRPTPYTATARSAQTVSYAEPNIGQTWLDWTNFSIGGWFWVDYQATATGEHQRLFDLYRNDSNRWLVYQNVANNLITATNGTNTFSTSATLVNQGWHHIVLTVSGATATLYLDGAEGGTTGVTVAASGPPVAYVGTTNAGATHLNGRVDDFSIIGRAMPASEVLAIFESNAPIFAETSTFTFRLPNNLVWGDSEGLWVRTDDGAAAFGISGVDDKSWGGTTLDKGDLLIGNSSGHYIRWTHASGTMSFVGNGGGVTSISGSNITTGTIDASVVNVTNINASNITTGALSANRIATGSLDANKITSGTITATQINGTTLSALFVNTGSLTVSDTLTIGTGSNAGIYQGTGTFASPETGLKIWRDGNIGRIGGFNVGVETWSAGIDGKLRVASGAITFDTGGIIMITTPGQNKIEWNGTAGDAYISVSEVSGDIDMNFDLPLSDSLYEYRINSDIVYELSATSADFRVPIRVTDGISPFFGELSFSNSGANLGMSILGGSPAKVQMDGPLVFAEASGVTISGGVINVTKSYTRIDTQGGAATDDLDTIGGGTTGQILVLRITTGARDVVVKHLTGNIVLNAATNCTLGASGDTLTLLYTGSQWIEISRSIL